MPRELLTMQNNFEWVTKEGQTLELENAKKSNARLLKIEGQTYQNLLGETKDLEYVSTKSGFNYIYTLDNLKANTIYTLSYEIKSSNEITTDNMTQLFRVENEKSDATTNVVAGFTGTVDNTYRQYKFTFDAGSDTVRTKINLRNQFDASSIGLTENTLSVRNLVLLEGDYINGAIIKELPTSINGIESVAEMEKEGDLYPAKLINKNKLGSNIYTEGDLNVKGSSSWYSIRKYVTVEPNTQYQINLDIESISKGSNDFTPFVEFYSNIKDASALLKRVHSSSNFTLTTNEDTTILIIVFVVNNATVSTTECEANFKNIGIYGAATTEISLPQPLRSLPNDVKDTIEGNKMIQRIGKLVVNGTNNIFISSVRENTILLYVTNSTIKNTIESSLPFLSDSLLKTTSCWSQDIEGIFQANKNNRFILSILRSKLAGTTANDIKAYFKENPMTLYYELETPIVHDLTIPSIYTEKGTNIITTTNNIKPKLSMKVKVKK